MTRGFADRVDAERRILRLVNKRFGVPYLSGLSGPAIEQWVGGDLNTDEGLVELLCGVSRRLRMEADVSRNVFEELDEDDGASIEEYEEKIRDLVKE